MTTQPDSQFEEFWLQRLTLATAEPPYARTTAETAGGDEAGAGRAARRPAR